MPNQNQESRDLPFVSIAIPCRNEEKFIARCLDSIVANDYPKTRLEVFVVDGLSEDNTRRIVADYHKKFPFITLVDNQKKITPLAMNIGIRASKGDYVLFLGAHTACGVRYVSKCVESIQKYAADNVGGTWKIQPQDSSVFGAAITSSISSVFGSGNAYYKTTVPKEPKEVDTVFGGCYSRKVFEKIGLFNEKLTRSQDLEFNLRLKKNGGKILLVPGIVGDYYPKNSFSGFAKHNFDDGFWVIYPLKFGIKTFTWRHIIPLLFVISFVGLFLLGLGLRGIYWAPLIIMALVYLALSVFFSAMIFIKGKKILVFLLLPLIFFVRHFSFGLGSLFAVFSLSAADKGENPVNGV